MRELYIDGFKVKRLINPPKRTRGILTLQHPERLLSPSSILYKYPADYFRQPFETTTPIRCNAVITNKEHDGLWLFNDVNNGSIKLFAKNMEEEDEDYIKHGEPISSIYRTILKFLYESIGSEVDPYGRITDDALLLRLKSILGTYGLSLVSTEFPIYYSYFMEEYNDELNLYVIIEVNEPGYPAHFSETNKRLAVWYSRYDHEQYMKYHYHPEYIYTGDDIRENPRGLKILDKILTTESLFGKLNIY